MADITSTQAGDWSVGATWVGGVAPVAADNVIIEHTVVMDLNDDVNDYGYVDIKDEGSLTFDAGATCLRLAGKLYIRGGATGSTLEMVAGSTLKFANGIGTTYGIEVSAAPNANFYAEGTCDVPRTQVNNGAGVAVGDAYVTVDDATIFATDEYVTVFPDDWPIAHIVHSDEGFTVHTVNVNDVYMKRRVGPTTKLNGAWAAGSTLTVDNASLFAVGYQIIMDTAGNTGVYTITAINFTTNVITVSAANPVANHGDDLDIYQTGFEKAHEDNDYVQKVAAVVATECDSGQADLIVSNADSYEIGDIIRVEYYSSDCLYDYRYCERKEIQGIVGTTLTMTDNFSYKHEVGSLVVKLTRDCHIMPTDPDYNWYHYAYQYLTNYSRIWQMRHVWLDGVGLSASTAYRGTGGYGHWGRDGGNGFCIDSCTFDNPNTYAFFNSAVLGVWRYWYYSRLSNNVFSGGSYYGTYLYYGYYIKMFNNISTGIYYRPYYINMVYTDTSLTSHDLHTYIEYNHASNCNEYATFLYNDYNIFFFCNYNRWRNTYYSPTANTVPGGSQSGGIRRASIQNIYNPMSGGDTMCAVYYDSELSWRAAGTTGGSGYSCYWRMANGSMPTFVKYNFEHGVTAHFCYRGHHIWDKTENAWKSVPRVMDSYADFHSFVIEIPQATTVTMKTWVKRSSDYNGYAYLGYHSHNENATPDWNDETNWLLTGYDDGVWIEITKSVVVTEPVYMTFYWHTRGSVGHVFVKPLILSFDGAGTGVPVHDYKTNVLVLKDTSATQAVQLGSNVSIGG